MKNMYLFKGLLCSKFTLLSVLLFLCVSVVLRSQNYTSNAGTYNYEDASAWGKTQPPADGVLSQMISISAGSEITRGDVGSGDDIEAQGDARGYSGKVYGTFTVQGNLSNTNTFQIYNGGKVEVFGNFTANGELIVDDGGVLIVHGDLHVEDVWGWGQNELNGTIVVVGDAVIDDFEMDDTAVLVVGGDLTVDGNWMTNVDAGSDIYVLDPNADVDGGGYIDESTDVGDADDFENEQAGNTDLVDIVENLGLVSSVDKPTNLTFSNLTGTTADLSWTRNADLDDVIIAYSLNDLSGKPIDGTVYNVNDALPDGAIVIYSGSLETYKYTGFTQGVFNYIRIWSVNSSVEYSTAAKITVKTLSADEIFYEDFESGSTGWILGNDMSEWYVGSAVAYMGSNSAYVTADGGATASYEKNIRFGSSTIDLERTIAIPSTYKSAELSFYWKAAGEAGYDGGSVSENGTYLVDELSLSSQDTWVEKVVDITDYIGTDFDLAFSWTTDFSMGEDPGLCIDEVRIVGSDVAKPQSFIATASSGFQIDLDWKKSTDNDEVIIAYSAYGTIGRPESGTNYDVGDYLEGGGKILYVGSAEGYSHTGNFSGKLTYCIWSVNSLAYSSGITAEVQVPIALPFVEGFEADTKNWLLNNSSYLDEWVFGKATAYQGSSSAYISNDKGITTSYDEDYAVTYMDVEVDLRNYSSVSLSFWWKGEGQRRSAYGSVYMDDTEVLSNLYGNTDWKKETVDLSAYAGSIKTLRFMWYNGGEDGTLGWCIDDIYITGTIDDPGSFYATNLNVLYNDLAWTQNSYADDVMIAWSDNGVFGTPVEGTQYDVGDEIPGGGTVLSIGRGLSEVHEPLKYGTVYYYKAWSVRNGIYSSGLTSSANTPNKVTVLSEDWENASDGYPEWSTTQGDIDTKWLKGGAKDYYTGSLSAYITTNGTDPGYNNSETRNAQLSVDIDLEDLQSASLSFAWKSLGEIDYDYGEVYLGGKRLSASKEYVDNSSWQVTTINLDAYCGVVGEQTLEFRWVNDDNTGSSPGFCIDDIDVGGIYAATSIVDNSSRLSSSISSLANSLANGISVFQFDLTDKTSLYKDATRIQQLVISKGAVNEIANWNDALAGALLFGPDLDAAGLAGTVTSASITFTGTDMILLDVQDTPETYYLKVWLKSDLNNSGIKDNEAFDFAMESNNIVTGLGDDFVIDLVEESGAVAIDVDATNLVFTQQPPEYATKNAPLSPIPEVSALDANGNMDLDFTSSVNLTNSGGLGMNPVSYTAVNGVVTFGGLIFTETGVVTLNATYSGLTTAISQEINIQDYCIPSQRSSKLYINNLILNKINNTSGDDGGYGDYLDLKTSLTIGIDYDINLGVYNSGAVKGNVQMWIDWDQSSAFDSDERIDIGTSTGSGVSLVSGTVTIPDDQDAVTGSTRMRIQVLDNGETIDACVSSSEVGETEDYMVIIATDGWQGTSTLWNVGQNWSSGSVPDLTTDVYVPEHPYNGDVFPIVSGNANMNDLEIAKNAKLTFNEGSRVNINGDIDNKGSIVINNTVENPVSLINKGTVSGSGEEQINWSLDELRYWYIGHSVSGLSMADYTSSLKSSGNDYLLYQWDNGWVNISESSHSFSEPLEGYSLMIKDPGSVLTYSGKLNSNTSYTMTNMAAQWHLVANPYASYINLDDAGVDLGNFLKSTWTRTDVGGGERSFATYNILAGVGQNGGDQYVAPGQSIYFRTYTANDAITISSSSRAHATGSLKSNSLEQDVIRITLQSEFTEDESVVVFRDSGSEQMTAYDSEKKLAAGKVANFYSLKDGNKAAINTLPKITKKTIVPLGYNVASEGISQFTLKVNNLDYFIPEVSVYLKDNQEDGVIDLREVQEYVFMPEFNQSEQRFELVFDKNTTNTSDVTTDTNDLEASISEIEIYTVDQVAYVHIQDNLLQKDGVIYLYDISGALIKQVVANSTHTEIKLPKLNAIYMVKVIVGDTIYNQKVESL